MIEVPKLDLEAAVREITGFIKRTVEEAGSNGVVLGLSGGVDSSVVAALCAKALGGERCLGVIMPAGFTPKEDVEDAEKLARSLGMKTARADIEAISDAFFKTLGVDLSDPRCKIPAANLRARIRMAILYYYANLNNLLVAGTGDKSERLIGYFTKYGDGGVDFMPIAHLYKTQVRELGEHLGLPERILNKPSSPQLYPGHKAVDEIPADYGLLDRILVGLFDLKLPPRKVSELTGAPLETVLETLSRFNSTKHKRAPPPMLEG